MAPTVGPKQIPFPRDHPIPVANNLANLVTPGFKSEMEVFTTYPIRSQSFGTPQKM